MPFTVHPHPRFPVHCAMTYNARPFLKLPLAYSFGFALLVTLLLLSSGRVYAEWVSVGKTERGVTVYVDAGTIPPKDDLRKVWYLLDFETKRIASGTAYLSSMAQREFDCAEERSRLLAFMFFSRNMGSGMPVYTNSDEGNWEPVAPESVVHNLFEYACGKK